MVFRTRRIQAGSCPVTERELMLTQGEMPDSAAVLRGTRSDETVISDHGKDMRLSSVHPLNLIRD
jgi:hypothetical protein